jgi:transcriptional regulator with XRE-family HTH domain
MTTGPLQLWLREQLRQRKMTQAKLAARAKLSEAYISQIVTGKREGREEETRRRIAQALGISYEQLIREVDGVEQAGRTASSVERAIREDPDLTAGQQRILLDAYFELRGRR